MPTDTLSLKAIPDPWLTFLRELDDSLDERVEMHCIGAFALLILTSVARPTADIDFIEAVPDSGWRQMMSIAREGSALAVKYGLYLHEVTIAEYPCEYRDRLIDITPAAFRRLTIKLLEPYDLVLTKLSRNSPKDRDDVMSLVKNCRLKREVLSERFEVEFRPYIQTAEERTISTMKLWLEEFFEE